VRQRIGRGGEVRWATPWRTEEYDVDFAGMRGGRRGREREVGVGEGDVVCEDEFDAICDAVYLGVVPGEGEAGWGCV
jgi:hypothetical protein